MQAQTPKAKGQAMDSVAPAPAPAATFAGAPLKGWIIRSNCRMGGCGWYRFEAIESSGGNTAPNYNLRLMPGESSHPDDPYPNTSEGVDIQWQSAAASAQVVCSASSPYAAVENHAEQLRLNLQGVAGASQGLANLYFATCHGEYGDDAALARKFGYDLR